MFTCTNKNTFNNSCKLNMNHENNCHYHMKVIIAGGRDFNDYDLARDKLYEISEHITNNQDITIISGGARGADSIGTAIADNHGTGYKEYLAEWDKHGKSAGYRRNELMANNADTLLAFWDGKSKGTKHMITLANTYKLKVYVIKY